MMKIPQRAGTTSKCLLLAGCALLLLSPAPVPAQVTTGTPGSPGATTTIDGKQFRRPIRNSAG